MIITNNTAHKTICAAGFGRSVPSEIRQKAHYSKGLGYGDCGHDFDCTVKDARKALRDVYENYEIYKRNALCGREWVKKYLWSNLKDDFLTLFKPGRVVFGEKNILENGCLMTNSSNLYYKYCKLIETSSPTEFSPGLKY